MYTLTTFWAYNIIMYRMKYADPPINKTIVNILFGSLALFGTWVVIGALHQGTTYLYQELMGLLYGGIFLVLVMNFDKSIHRQCEKTGFELEVSRKYKFYLFFLCIGLMTAISIYYLSLIESWITHLIWLENMTDTEKYCEVELAKYS